MNFKNCHQGRSKTAKNCQKGTSLVAKMVLSVATLVYLSEEFMERKKVQKRTIINFIIKIFWIFIIGSVFGFFAEMLYTLVYSRTLQIRQGLIYGPFIQVYGVGAIAYYILVSKVKTPKEVFIYGTVMGGVLEYLFSFFQEIFFGTISWDYSKFFLNLNGRICLLYCV